MNLFINGEQRTVKSETIEQLIAELELNGQLLVVEMAGEIIARENWSNTSLSENKSIELVHFVGGG
ncbi:sulfur carrier protein ThiS [Shouchella sp. JSM 1781072]|uniref:sulfur carrier protein ThiS n=1 Tax=Bacillaceae TaxID=186817 RepID=UPI000C0739D7|nr:MULTISPECIES: sulfur carrier protein ThiS [Bacillaceae]UTR07994.1 sulfur carrier protein ThiS [Alkalihalobacillus sp. LMS6]